MIWWTGLAPWEFEFPSWKQAASEAIREAEQDKAWRKREEVWEKEKGAREKLMKCAPETQIPENFGCRIHPKPKTLPSRNHAPDSCPSGTLNPLPGPKPYWP